ncbi:STE3-domain-containing protein [Auriscalpium vulgare]|uniref:STE3-domain-containing protein n=1 Tax=Auriscalpium vulgare TaxID=40419 RepID=A0ACB8SBC0_9AGAM|nr:STE3-domain-containing protein [Auriscalpium vulgare]
MAAPPNQLFSAFSFIGFLFCAVPFSWHLESWNAGTCLYMAWTGLGCLNAFINSVVWNGSARNVAPVWCDISTRFMIGLNVAIPAASLVINRRLYKIASMSAAMITPAEKRRGVIIDLSIGLGIPLLEMILQVIVQGHRFDIYEDVGCFPVTYNTPPAYPLVFCWPLVIGIVSLTYSAAAVCLFWKRASQFKDIVSSNRNLNQNRYLRLIALSTTEMVCTIPLSVYSLYLNSHVFSISPWLGWADTHFDFGRVGQFSDVQWRMDPVEQAAIELSRWLIVFCAFAFFAFFGFADEARKHYLLAYASVCNKVGHSTVGSRAGTTGSSFASPSMITVGGNGFTSLKNISLPMFRSQVSKRSGDTDDTDTDTLNSESSSWGRLSTSITIDNFDDCDGIVKKPALGDPARPPSLDTLDTLDSLESFDSPPLVPPKPVILLTAPAHDADTPSEVSVYIGK